MKNILKLASCGKNSDDNQTENARIVGTWKNLEIVWVDDNGVRETSTKREEDDGCRKTVFTNKKITFFSKENNKCVSQEGSYKIENSKIYIKGYNKKEGKDVEVILPFKFINDDTFEWFEGRTDGTRGWVHIFKRVK
ncbi:hypothetical protein ACILE2_06625 [Capnocytophaga canimorsus]|uniref:hypothetical protein n=1 Tax=Capnocytophaga canimorsus TaxID=28188 RepID=UPI0037CFC409